MVEKIKSTVVISIIPIILLFGYFFSNLGLKMPLLLMFGFLLILFHIFFSLKIFYTDIIIIFFLFYLWGTLLFFGGNAQNKLIIFINFSAAAFMMIGIYYYALYGNAFNFKYFIFIFIIISFVIAFLEVKFNIILPTSGKKEAYYARMFYKIPTSVFFNPNDFATAIGILFIYIYSYCKMMKYVVRYLILFCCLYIIYFTGSRGVQLTVLLLPLVYTIINKKSIVKILLIYIFMLSIVLILFNNNIFSKYNMNKYLVTVKTLGQKQLDSSLLARWEMITYTFKNIKEVIIGLGPGGSSLFLRQFRIPNPHNFFIEILIDYGIIGLILTLSIFIISIGKNYRLLKKEIPDELKASCKSTIILFYLFILFSAISSSLFNLWPFAWFPVYLTLVNEGINKKIQRKINSL
jgi:O-antigen ligase